MKANLSEEIDFTASSNNPAAQTSGRHPKNPQADARRGETNSQRQPTSLGNFAAVIALSIAFFTLLLLSLRATQPPTVAQTFELPPRPIWISTVPYAPRDGLVPDFGPSQPSSGQPAVIK